MVPLEKGGKGQGENKHAAFTVGRLCCGAALLTVLQVEIIWVDDDKDGAHVSKMQQRGALDFFFPKVDMPLNVVLVSVYVPTGFRYAEFTV